MISVGAALPFFFVLYLSTFFLLFFYFSILLSSHLSPIYFYLLHISSLLLYSLSPSFLLFISQLIYLFYRGFFFSQLLGPFSGKCLRCSNTFLNTIYMCCKSSYIVSKMKQNHKHLQ